MNESPEDSNNSGGNDLDTLDYLRGVKSSTCLLLPTTPSPTPLDFKHPLSEEMSDRPFLTLNDDPNMVNIQTGKKVLFMYNFITTKKNAYTNK